VKARVTGGRRKGIRPTGKNRYNLPSANNKGLARSIDPRSRESARRVCSFTRRLNSRYNATPQRAATDVVLTFILIATITGDGRNKVIIINQIK